MDVHVPMPITRQLRLRGVDVVTATEAGTNRLEDHELLQLATTEGRAVFTHDIRFNPNSEAAIARRAAARGAHAAGVSFSAARRKPRSTHFSARRRKLELGHEGLGGPPKPARGPRALPILISEFGFKALAEDWQRAGRSFAGMLYGHAEGASIGQYVRDLELIAKVASAEELADAVLHLPL